MTDYQNNNQVDKDFILACDCGCAEFLIEKYAFVIYCAECFSTWTQKDNQVTKAGYQGDLDQKTKYFLLDTLARQTIYISAPDTENPSVIDIMNMV